MTEKLAKQETTLPLLLQMAERYKMTPQVLVTILQEQVFPKEVDKKPYSPSQAEMIHFLSIAEQYNLNPFAREIWPFPSKGGILPVASVDGWKTIVSRRPDYAGMDEQHIHKDPNDLESPVVAVRVEIYRFGANGNRYLAGVGVEHMKECRRQTSMWEKWSIRMLTHKAYIQAAKKAYGLSGIYDVDEAERFGDRLDEVVERVVDTGIDRLKQKLEEARRPMLTEAQP